MHALCLCPLYMPMAVLFFDAVSMYPSIHPCMHFAYVHCTCRWPCCSSMQCLCIHPYIHACTLPMSTVHADGRVVLRCSVYVSIHTSMHALCLCPLYMPMAVLFFDAVSMYPSIHPCMHFAYVRCTCRWPCCSSMQCLCIHPYIHACTLPMSAVHADGRVVLRCSVY